METIIQLISVTPYETIATIPFLYDKPKNAELIINDKVCIVDNIRDRIDGNGKMKRFLRVFYAR
jgi:hypothetical protein